MRSPGNSSSNPFQILEPSNTRSLKWLSEHLLRKVHYIELQSSLTTVKPNYTKKASPLMKHCWELLKNMRLNVPFLKCTEVKCWILYAMKVFRSTVEMDPVLN